MAALYDNEPDRWHAVQQRSVKADGEFVFAVATTGIYCRPSCPARHPKRENVEFFGAPAEAEAAGYRPCKRCAPDRRSLHERHLQAINEACRLIEDSDPAPGLKELSEALGLSPSHFHRLFKRTLGITPKEYAMTCRDRRLQSHLVTSPGVTHAIYEAGYGSSSRVYEKSYKTLGMTPSEFRSGAAGLEIDFAIAESALGWLLVAATSRGVCLIEFGDDQNRLRRRLRERFPHAELRADRGRLNAAVGAVAEYIEAPERGLDLPLDIQGTAFQRRVWRALQEIPLGQTATYSEIAEKLGQPTASRAVAGACASNKLAVAIPCHRVVRKNGNLGGYRWGLRRKSELLAAEQRAARAVPERNDD